MSGFLTPPQFNPPQAPITVGTTGQVLTVTAPGKVAFANAGGGGGGGIGGSINFASPSGTVDPAITGFTAGLGTAGTGRIKITLTADTAWEGLPGGVDGQQLFGTIVAGNHILTLLQPSQSATAQKTMLTSQFPGASYQLGDTFQAFYDGGLGQWVIVA